MLSGKHYQQDEVDTVTTVHQPGSSFKPYVLTAAFEQGIPPTAIYSGVQGVIPDPRCMTNGQPWNVTNAEGTSLGSMNLYDATAYSVNAVFARLILDVGPENVVAVAHAMGITRHSRPCARSRPARSGSPPWTRRRATRPLRTAGSTASRSPSRRSF